jgi:hypothetical protein
MGIFSAWERFSKLPARDFARAIYSEEKDFILGKGDSRRDNKE